MVDGNPQNNNNNNNNNDNNNNNNNNNQAHISDKIWIVSFLAN